MAKGSTKGGGNASANNAKEMKMFLKNRMWKEHYHIIFGALAVIIALFAWFFIQAANAKQILQFIQLHNQQDIDRVFRSGEPWVVLCSSEDAVLPEVFDKASKRLVGKVNVGVMNCNDKLPSGKSVYNKFLIREDIAPSVFTVANGEKPKQLFLNYLQKPKALATQTLLQVKKTLHEVQNTKQLDDKCLGKSLSSCVLVYRTGKKFDDYQKQWLQVLMEENRLIKFVWADASILKLSIDSIWKKPATVDQNRIVLFKKVKGDSNVSTFVKSYTSYFEELPVRSFLEQYTPLKADEKEFRQLSKVVTLKRRPKPTPATRTKPSTSDNNNDEPKRSPAEIAELERRRREQMEEESKQFYPEQVHDDEEGEEAETPVEESEEEVLDLDEL